MLVNSERVVDSIRFDWCGWIDIEQQTNKSSSKDPSINQEQLSTLTTMDEHMKKFDSLSVDRCFVDCLLGNSL